MESSFILENFLLKNSNLEGIIPYHQFKKECGDLSDDTARHLYQELLKQRSSVTGSVKAKVEEVDNIPIDFESKSTDKGIETVPRVSVENLVNELFQLEDKLQSNMSRVDEKISEEMESIKRIIDELNDLKYGKSWSNVSDVDTIMKEAEASVAKCERMFD